MSDAESTESMRPVSLRLRLEIAGLALLLAAAFLLRVYALDRADISIDEDLNISAVEQPLFRILDVVGTRPPLAFVMQKLTGMILGRADAFTIRFASTLEGVAAVLLMWHLARRMAGPGAGWICALLLAFSHYHCIYSREGRYYSLLTLGCLAFLWGYWEFFQAQRWRFFAVIFFSALLVAGTHLSGLLFVGTCFAALPVFLCSRAWLDVVLRKPLVFAVSGLGAVAAGALGMLIERNRVSVLWAVAKQGLHANVMTSNFDVSPGFLFLQFAEYNGLPELAAYFAAILFIIGLLYAAAKRPRLAVLAVCIIAGPFFLTYLLKPHTATVWRNRYYIFVMPMIFLVEAMGIEAAARFMFALYARILRREAGRVLRIALPGTLVVLFVAVNLCQMYLDYRDADRSLQDTAAFLDASAKSGEEIACTQWFSKYNRKDLSSKWDRSDADLTETISPKASRVFRPSKNIWDMRVSMRRYFRPEEGMDAIRLIRDPGQIGWMIENSFSNWYLHHGSWTCQPEIADFVLSDRLSRMPIGNLWVAHGPGIQNIRFGENAPGAPESAGPLRIGPGQEITLDILCPRDGTRVVTGPIIEDSTPDLAPKLKLASSESWIESTLYGNIFTGKLTLARGRTGLIIANVDPSREVVLESLRLLPELTDEGLEIPAWDFHQILNGYNKQSIYLEPEHGGTLVRGMRSTPHIYYYFYSPVARKARIRLDAISDAPFPNVYEIGLPDATKRLYTLEFGHADDAVHSLETEPVSIVKGVNTLRVRFLPINKEVEAAMRGPLHVMTEARVQTNGMRSLAVVPEDS